MCRRFTLAQIAAKDNLQTAANLGKIKAGQGVKIMDERTETEAVLNEYLEITFDDQRNSNQWNLSAITFIFEMATPLDPTASEQTIDLD